MNQLQLFTHRERVLRSVCASLLVAFVLGVAFVAATAAPQSGRRTPASSKRNEPAPAATPEQSTGESESQPKAKTKKTDAAALTFIVSEFDDPFLNIFYFPPASIVDAFARRLGEAKTVEIVRGPKSTRQDARARAKKERDAYVVLVVIEDEAQQNGRGGVGQETNPRAIMLRYYVYAPQTADLKFQDLVRQRPYNRTTTIGGARIPVPMPAPRTSIPAQYEVEQLARDAANRLMSRFNIPIPPEN